MGNEKSRPEAIGLWEITQYCEEGKRSVLRRVVEEGAGLEVTVKTGLKDATIGKKIEPAVRQILDDLEGWDEEEEPKKTGKPKAVIQSASGVELVRVFIEEEPEIVTEQLELMREFAKLINKKNRQLERAGEGKMGFWIELV